LAVCFDQEFARLRGVSAEIYYLLLLILIAVTVVLMVMIVGIVLVIALLTLPAAVAGVFSSTLKRMMILSVVFCALFTSTGIAASYNLDLPSGPTIIVLSGFVYLLVLLFTRYLKPKN
jgi:zinc transport system permease protein